MLSVARCLPCVTLSVRQCYQHCDTEYTSLHRAPGNCQSVSLCQYFSKMKKNRNYFIISLLFYVLLSNYTNFMCSVRCMPGILRRPCKTFVIQCTRRQISFLSFGTVCFVYYLSTAKYWQKCAICCFDVRLQMYQRTNSSVCCTKLHCYVPIHSTNSLTFSLTQYKKSGRKRNSSLANTAACKLVNVD